MKRRFFIIASSLFLLILLSPLFSWIKGQCATPVPEPSVWGGYYEDSFTLELSAPSNGTIYYTLDGSAPTTDSAIYKKGIPIRNRSEEANVYSSIRNVVKDWLNYTPSSSPVEKGTVLRAIFVNDWGFTSEILTQTYFVGITQPANGYTLSLVFESDDLFGDNGIYVTGKEYDDWYLSGSETADAPIPNFEKDLEVPAVAELMDAYGDVMNQPVGMRLQGASARGMNKKRFTLVSREEYSGSQTFDIPLYENVTTHSVMLKSNLPDAIISDLVSDRSVATQASIPVRVFLNGEFWYNTYMLERYDNHYFRQHYQVNDRELIKDGILDDEASEYAEGPPYNEFKYWVATTDFSDASQWNQLKAEIDIQSYIDFITVNYYICNWDFSDDKNYLLWRSVTSGDSPYEDTRWRWCIYDIDSIEYTHRKFDVENAAEVNIFSCDLPYSDVKVNKTALFHSIKENPEFHQQFVLSFMDIVNNNFSVSNVESVLAKHGLTSDWKDGYFLKRPAYAVQHLADEFSLTGTLGTVEIRSSSSEMGSITVNTSTIDLSSGSWSGVYFTDYPITVTATANEGYEFIGWKGDADEAAATLTLSVDGGVSLEAVFAKVK